MEEPGRLHIVHGVSKSWTRLRDFTFILSGSFWRGKWQPTPVFLPGESDGGRSLVGYSLWGCKESDMTERLNWTELNWRVKGSFFSLMDILLFWYHLSKRLVGRNQVKNICASISEFSITLCLMSLFGFSLGLCWISLGRLDILNSELCCYYFFL